MNGLILKLLDHTLFRPGRNADYRCPTSWRVEGRRIDDYDLWYIRRGHGWIDISGAEYELYGGSLYLFRPGDIIHARHDPKDRLAVYYCHFRPSTSPLFSHLSLPRQSEYEPKEVERAFRTFFEDRSTIGEASPFSTRLLLYSIFRIWLRAGELAFATAGATTSRVDALLRAIDYLRLHLRERPSLEEVSRMCSLEKSSVNKLFREYTGMSPLQYHSKLRMEHAAYLLDSGLAVKNVASLLGYADPFSFSKAFKRERGISPTEYCAGSGELIHI